MMLFKTCRKKTTPGQASRLTIVIYIWAMMVLLYLTIRYIQMSSSASVKFLQSSHDSEDHAQRQDRQKKALVRNLAQELARKLESAAKIRDLRNRTCQSLNISYTETCNGTANSSCPPRYLPVRLEDRIEQIVLRENLQISAEHRSVLKDMQSALPGHYDVIIVSALSRNHYKESQALLKNLHEVVFPLLKNFTLVVYDLGLTEKEREEYKRYCRCHLLRFPFDSFPPHVRKLKCFGWKPLVIRAHYESANIVIWLDASIRIWNGSAVPFMIDRARNIGIQQRFMSTNVPNPFFTLIQMFDHYGDNPCAHMAIPQAETGCGIYHREPLVEKAILDPWCGCALQPRCTCPTEQHKVQACPSLKGLRKLGRCSRADQSSISIILGKLFQKKYHHVVLGFGWFQSAVRTSQSQYFEELKNKTDNLLKEGS